jgi:hypothetical protein
VKHTAEDISYPVFGENAPVKTDIRVFNTEYRVLQRKKHIDAEVQTGGKCGCRSIMQELLAAANGAAAYDFSLEILLGHVKEYCNAPQNYFFLPMTVIAWKNSSGGTVCSVERVFLKWDSRLTLEENLFFNAYMEQSDQVAEKLLRQKYDPVAVIGKGDFIRTLREVFADKLGYTVI